VAAALLVAAVLAATVGIGGSASARPYTAPHGKVIVGVTGGRTVDGYARAAGKRPGVFQFFVAWGDPFSYAYRRARQAGTGLMVHLSTYNGPGTKERITPRDIAMGRGDRYLISLGRDFTAYHRPVYLRLMSEMNNAANPYSAYDASGRARGQAHARSWFRQAWRRTYLVVKGGRVSKIDARLRALGMPRVRVPLAKRRAHAKAPGARAARARRHRVRWLARPKVAFQWAPMTAGSPNIGGNRPDGYWPGGAYVDWVGTDFYSRFPNFSGLDRLYANKRYAGKPFVFGEWAMWGSDNPGFMRQFFAWVAAHPRVRMLAYNQGNRTNGPFRLYRYPSASRVMRKALRSSRYTGRTPGGVPKLAPVGRKRSRPRSAPRQERSGARATTVAASRTTVAASTIRHVSAAAPLPYYKVVLALRSLAWPDVVPD
jgi:hypothetical protein